MNQWFSLSLTFGFLFAFLRKEESRYAGSRGIREIGSRLFYLALALGILIALHSLCAFLIWGPIGREDLATVSLFLWALLIDQGMSRLRKEGKRTSPIPLVKSPSFLALAAFSLWIVEKQSTPPSVERLLWGLGLPLGAGVVEGLLTGLRERVRLSNLPSALEGTPIFFWLAMLLSLAFGGFREILAHL